MTFKVMGQWWSRQQWQHALISDAADTKQRCVQKDSRVVKKAPLSISNPTIAVNILAHSAMTPLDGHLCIIRRLVLAVDLGLVFYSAACESIN